MSLLDLIVLADVIGTRTDLLITRSQQKVVRRVLRKMLDRHDAKWQPWYPAVKKLNERAKYRRLIRSDLAEVERVARTYLATAMTKPLSRRMRYAEVAQRAFTVEPLEAR